MINSEDSILKIISNYFPNTHNSFLMGRGDDCALVHVPAAYQSTDPPLNLLAITSDVFVENAHFRSRYFTPYEIGHKALAVNISDLASNGALPSSFSLNLTLTDVEDEAWLTDFCKGMSELANTYNMGLSGGDLAKIPSNTHASALNIGITAMGDYSHGGLPLMRNKSYTQLYETFVQEKSRIQNSTQTNNDPTPLKSSRQNTTNTCYHNSETQTLEADYVLFVIGEIGLARTGLFALENTQTKDDIQRVKTRFPLACKAHLTPQPLVYEGLFLSHFAHKYPIFCMDISDGLMRDIPRLLAQQGIFAFENTQNDRSFSLKALSAHITLSHEDIHNEVRTYTQENALDSLYFAYEGGEDYGLLGACSKEAWDVLTQEWAAYTISHNKTPLARLWKIGKTNSQENNLAENKNAHPCILLNGISITNNGFDHFQNK